MKSILKLPYFNYQNFIIGQFPLILKIKSKMDHSERKIAHVMRV